MPLDGDGPAGGRHSGLTRRRLLAGLGGVGAVGMASGAGTVAHFSDAEAFADNALGAGEVEIDLSLDASCRGCVASDDGRVHFAFDDIDRGDDGRNVLSVDVRTNPARLWLGTRCPPALDPLGDAIEATLTVGDFSRNGSLSGLRREFTGGLRLDDLDGDACLDPTGDPLEIVLDWNLPVETPDSVAGTSTAFDVQLYAEQCRHVSEGAAVGSNPFAALDPCDEPSECVVCDDGDRFARLTFEYLGSQEADVTARSRVAGQVGVVFEGTVPPGGAFTADGAAVGNDGELGTNLYLDDGSDEQPAGAQGGGNESNPADTAGRPPGLKIHTSCSEPLAVGQLFGPPEAPRYRLVAGEIAGKGQLCEAPDDGGPAEER